MNAEQFFNKVAEMRETQKAYFQTRDTTLLRKSRALEAAIDREIRRVREIKAAERLQAHIPTLFDDLKSQGQ